MVERERWLEWDAERAGRCVARPAATDDKYSRGVLGVRTGSDDYPGAAVLGVEAALRTGVGMVRYLGPDRASDLVLQRRPEAVTKPGRVQAWLLGSGMSSTDRDEPTTAALRAAVAEGLPTVLDAGALDLARAAAGPTVITPHHRELTALLAGSDTAPTLAEVSADPATWARRSARLLGVTVLLKGSVTYVASPTDSLFTVSGAPGWLATAGTGDVLAGVLGALLATRAELASTDPEGAARLAATAAFLHAGAARRASRGGPITALDVAAALPAMVAAALPG